MDTTTMSASASASFGHLGQLQLRTLRAAAWALAVSTVVRQLLWSPLHDAPLEVGRLVLLLYCVAVERWATEATAAYHGVALTAVLTLLTTLKALAAPDGRVVDFTAVYGAHRVVPLLAAVFGGTGFCLATSAWAAAATVAALCLKRAAARGIPLLLVVQNPVDGGRLFAEHELEVSMLWTELQYIGLVAALACFLVSFHRQALATLADALQARQRFVSHMVRILQETI